MKGSLEGIRILDFSHVLAGPIASNFLSLHGADVIKVEPEDGDVMRSYAGEMKVGQIHPSFSAVNAGKRSIVLDLKNEAGLDVAKRLVARADVVIENFRPGVMRRLGLGYDECAALRSGLVYCSISGFGQTGPLKNLPAIDQIIQSTSGLMNLSGQPGSDPMRVGFPVVDSYTGLLAAFAILSALQLRGRTGLGQYLDVAMLDAAMLMMIPVAGPYLAAGIRPQKTGNTGYSKAPTADTFKTADGWLTLGVIQQGPFEKLCKAVERPQLASDPRFGDVQSRQKNGDTLRHEVELALAARSALEWERILGDLGLPASTVRELPDALALVHLEHRSLSQTLARDSARSIKVFGQGYVSTAVAELDRLPPPRLGEHTDEILAELGNEDVSVIAPP